MRGGRIRPAAGSGEQSWAQLRVAVPCHHLHGPAGGRKRKLLASLCAQGFGAAAREAWPRAGPILHPPFPPPLGLCPPPQPGPCGLPAHAAPHAAAPGLSQGPRSDRFGGDPAWERHGPHGEAAGTQRQPRSWMGPRVWGPQGALEGDMLVPPGNVCRSLVPAWWPRQPGDYKLGQRQIPKVVAVGGLLLSCSARWRYH